MASKYFTYDPNRRRQVNPSKLQQLTNDAVGNTAQTVIGLANNYAEGEETHQPLVLPNNLDQNMKKPIIRNKLFMLNPSSGYIKNEKTGDIFTIENDNIQNNQQNTGLEIIPDQDLSEEEVRKLTQMPTRVGTRRRSNLEGKFAPGQSPREVYHRNFQRSRDYNPGVSKAGRYLRNIPVVGSDSGFSEEGQAARNQTRRIRALRDQAILQNRIDLENIEQAGALERADISNREAMNRALIQETGRMQARNIKEQRIDLERENIDINRMRAETDAAYKQYLLNNQDNKNVLTSAQWMDQDRSYRSAWNERFDPTTGTAGQNDYMDIDGLTPIDYMLGMYRDNPIAALQLYGEPNSKMKALVDLNMNPDAWLKYISASPEQREQIIKNRIDQKGY